MRLLATTLAVFVVGHAVGASAQVVQREFEVASVKPSAAGAAFPSGIAPVFRSQPGGRYMIRNAPLKALIRVAYGVEDFQVTGGPSWANSDRFDIEAKAASETPTTAELHEMLRALLASRFALKVHSESKNTPTFSLQVAAPGKFGPALKPTQTDCNASRAQPGGVAQTGPPPNAAASGRGLSIASCGAMPVTSNGKPGIRAVGQSLATLARMLSQVTGRIVADKTALTGLYDYEIEFNVTEFLGRAADAGVVLPPPTGAGQGDGGSPALLTALREQLGLVLVTENSPITFIVIDSVEKPSAN